MFGNKTARIQSITESLYKKNILYVKLFQAIAMNKQWIDDDVNQSMLRFTDKVGYTEEDIDTNLLDTCKREYQLVAAETTTTTKYIFDFFGNVISEYQERKEQPIRSGMISLIYKMRKVGQCGSSGHIILKMKRRGIEEKMNESIENILFLLDILSHFKCFKVYDIFTSIQKNIESLRKQLDFEEEINNLLESKHNTESLSFVEIPDVYPEVTNKYKNVIMMNYLSGNTIEEVAPSDYPIYAKMLMNYNMSALLINGMSHGDLHPGNILFVKEAIKKGGINEKDDTEYKYKIGLIDFGIVIRISEETRRNIFATLIQMYIMPIEKVARDLIFYSLEPRETLEKIPEKHMNNIIDICCHHFRSVIEKKDDFNLMKLYDFIYELNDYNRCEEMREFVLTIHEDIIKMQMSLAMINGIVSLLTQNQIMKCLQEEVGRLGK
jgi:predicted unusual protein kinase regulating ubiquinone biosynthesis (AarF/ABC1/UbiB family)